MKHYKNLNGQVFGFDDNQLRLVTPDMLEMTDAEFEAFKNPMPTIEQKLEQLRAERNRLLAELDRPMWLASLTDDQKAVINTYYQDLLAATETGTIPNKPEFIK